MEIRGRRSIHSLREFLKEIGTITIGILIALALESLVSTHRDANLVRHARTDLRAELQHNRGNLIATLASSKQSQRALQALISYGEGRLAGRHPTVGDISLKGNITVLNTSAWESTVATQALVHMRYDQAQALTRAYAASRVFNDQEERLEDRWIRALSMPRSPDRIADRDWAGILGELKVASNYNDAVIQAGQAVLESYDRALDSLQH
jgi:hypothetical protein